MPLVHLITAGLMCGAAVDLLHDLLDSSPAAGAGWCGPSRGSPVPGVGAAGVSGGGGGRGGTHS